MPAVVTVPAARRGGDLHEVTPAHAEALEALTENPELIVSYEFPEFAPFLSVGIQRADRAVAGGLVAVPAPARRAPAALLSLEYSTCRTGAGSVVWCWQRTTPNRGTCALE